MGGRGGLGRGGGGVGRELRVSGLGFRALKTLVKPSALKTPNPT